MTYQPNPENSESDPNAPLASLVWGEGSGTPIAAASGDVAGSPIPGIYTAVTQASTVVTYHLLQHDGVDRDDLGRDLALLDGWGRGTPAYRAESPSFRRWLDSFHAGDPTAIEGPSSEPASRVTGLGVWFRKDPVRLVESALSVSRRTHLDASTAVVSVAVASAVAGSCMGMLGSDLLFGAAEACEMASERLVEEAYRFEGIDGIPRVISRVRALVEIWACSPTEIVGSLCDVNGPFGIEGALVGLALGASLDSPVRLIEVAAMAGGSETGAIAGGILGARSGLRRWPWRVPNEMWFAEIGRRLAAFNNETRDLPVPHAVEGRLGSPSGEGHEHT